MNKKILAAAAVVLIVVIVIVTAAWAGVFYKINHGTDEGRQEYIDSREDYIKGLAEEYTTELCPDVLSKSPSSVMDRYGWDASMIAYEYRDSGRQFDPAAIINDTVIDFNHTYFLNIVLDYEKHRNVMLWPVVTDDGERVIEIDPYDGVAIYIQAGFKSSSETVMLVFPGSVYASEDCTITSLSGETRELNQGLNDLSDLDMRYHAWVFPANVFFSGPLMTVESPNYSSAPIYATLTYNDESHVLVDYGGYYIDQVTGEYYDELYIEYHEDARDYSFTERVRLSNFTDAVQSYFDRSTESFQDLYDYLEAAYYRDPQDR